MLRHRFLSYIPRRSSTLPAALLLLSGALASSASAETPEKTAPVEKPAEIIIIAPPVSRATVALLPPAPGEAPTVIIEKTATPKTTLPPKTSLPPKLQRDPNAPNYTSEKLATLAARRGLNLPLRDANIVIRKASRRLDIRSGGTIVKSYRVELGANPSGDKTRQGDNKTPEGQFFICTRNSTTSAFHIFLGLSYPALQDAQRGLQSKQISRREYDSIRSRLSSRQTPLWETKLGGWIGIHGGADAPFAQRKKRERGRLDWTAGCIAVTDAEIEELHSASQMRTPVLVLP